MFGLGIRCTKDGDKPYIVTGSELINIVKLPHYIQLHRVPKDSGYKPVKRRGLDGLYRKQAKNLDSELPRWKSFFSCWSTSVSAEVAPA